MEAGGGGGGGGGPAPFLVKTYEMIDDTSTDNIVSWSSTMNSFVVWDPPEFSRLLLPTYFKHNNFSSFIRQLNTYGFRKIDPERWEFANDEFAKGKKHLLKNIHRRKPIHSHSNPPASSGLDSERAAFEEEIGRLMREKNTLQDDVLRVRRQNTATKSQLKDLDRRVKDMEERQQTMTLFLLKAVKNPIFVDHLIRLAGASSADFSVLSKKRRQLSMLEDNDMSQERLGNCSSDENSGGHMIPQDFSSKLKLELSPAMVNSRSSNDGAESPRIRQLEGNQLRTECLSFVSELMDTGVSSCPKKDVQLPWQLRNFDDSDEHIPCHLNLTLASSSLQFRRSFSLEKGLNSASLDMDSGTEELRPSNASNECDTHEVVGKDKINDSNGDTNRSVLQEPPTANNLESAPVTGKNDVFWEQFLTERPGCSEEASSRLRSNPQEESKEAKRLGNNALWGWNSIDKLTL